LDLLFRDDLKICAGHSAREISIKPLEAKVGAIESRCVIELWSLDSGLRKGEEF